MNKNILKILLGIFIFFSVIRLAHTFYSVYININSQSENNETAASDTSDIYGNTVIYDVTDSDDSAAPDTTESATTSPITEWGKEKAPLLSREYINGKCIYYANEYVPEKRDDIYVMYNLLSDKDKMVYNLFMDLVENRNGEDYTSGIIVSDRDLAQIDEDHFWYIYYAMLNDHPEFFSLRNDSDLIECYTLTDDDYKAYMYSISAVSATEAKQQKAFYDAVDNFMKDIDLSLSDEEIELAIHDKLIDLVSYDYELLERSDNPDFDDLGFTAYGALVCNSKGVPNYSVCAGYSYAFEYLCQQAGIPCSVIAGDAIDLEDPEDQEELTHAWNIVKVNGKWYELDVTWDDIEWDESDDLEFYEELQKDTEKYNNALHHFYNRTTAEMEYLEATDDTLFYVEGYSPYNLQYDTSHVRFKEYTGTVDDIDVFINSLLPIAE